MGKILREFYGKEIQAAPERNLDLPTKLAREEKRVVVHKGLSEKYRLLHCLYFLISSQETIEKYVYNPQFVGSLGPFFPAIKKCLYDPEYLVEIDLYCKAKQDSNTDVVIGFKYWKYDSSSEYVKNFLKKKISFQDNHEKGFTSYILYQDKGFSLEEKMMR